MSYAELEMMVIQWGEERGIVRNSWAGAQARKTLEECGELLEACAIDDFDGMKDAYGDILVTLILGCATADLNLTTCLEHAYNEIKNRKGYMRHDGVFVKEST